METKKKGTIVIGKKTILAIGAILVIAASYFAWTHLKPLPDAKTSVMNYVREKSGRAPWTPVDSLAQQKQPWVELENLLSTDNDYLSMYRHLGEYLTLADHWLSAKDGEQQLFGLRLALTAARGAQYSTEDIALAAGICEGFLISNLSLVEGKTTPVKPPRDQLVNTAIGVFQQETPENQIAVYNRILSRETTLHQFDWARSQLAAVMQRSGKPKEAAALLQEIKDPSKVDKKTSKRIAKLLGSQPTPAATNTPPAR